MFRSPFQLAVVALLCPLFVAAPAEAPGQNKSGNVVPAAFIKGDACETRSKGTACSGYFVWNRQHFYGPKLTEFDRRFVFPHELFHAVQFAYLPFRQLWCCSNGVSSTGPGGWLIEGMAEAAALDWADSRGTSYAPAEGTNWRYDGRRYYSCPLHRPSSTLGYYATSSFWRFLKRKCGSHAIFQATLANDPKRVEQCPAIAGTKPETVRPADDFGKRFWFLDENDKEVDRAEVASYEFALQTAYAYYRDAGFEPPCLRYDPAPDWSTSNEYVVHHAELTATQEAESKDICPKAGNNRPQKANDGARPVICASTGNRGDPDTAFLTRIDHVLSHFLARLCSGGKNVSVQRGLCGKFQSDQLGGLAVAYLVFINEFSEQIFTGEIPVPAGEATTELFHSGCVPSENSPHRLDLPELASQCIQPHRRYSTDNAYHVIARGPLEALSGLQLGWHGCHVGPLGTRPDGREARTGEKYWELKPHLGRPGCQSGRDDYTLVFSNVVRHAHKTRPISDVTVSIEAKTEVRFSQ